MANPDFSAFVQRAKDANPEAIFIFAPGGAQPVALGKALVERGLDPGKVKILGQGEITDDAALRGMGDAALGIITAYHYDHAHESAKNREFAGSHRLVGRLDRGAGRRREGAATARRSSADRQGMNRTGLVIALGIATVAGVIFALYPELDIGIARPFYDPARQIFPLVAHPLLRALRDVAMWVVALLVAPAVIALVLKLVWPFARMLMPGRAAVFLIVTLVLGPGLLVNMTLKEHWPRSRPIDVPELGGSGAFVPWWDPRGVCPSNCSFVAGESAGAFWTLAPAALTPLPWRPVAYAAALTFGAAVGVLRIMFGGHFFSDVVFAGVFIFLITWAVHGVLYRWRLTRIADESVERALERLSMPLYRAVGGIIARTRRAQK